MHNEWSWTQNYYTEGDRTKLAEWAKDMPAEVVEQSQRDWAALTAEVEAAKLEDPASDHAQALAKRWRALVSRFTRGETGIQEGLKRLWSDPTNWPKDFQKPWSDEAGEFIERANEALRFR